MRTLKSFGSTGRGAIVIAALTVVPVSAAPGDYTLETVVLRGSTAPGSTGHLKRGARRI
jgi:hypothetical protein